MSGRERLAGLEDALPEGVWPRLAPDAIPCTLGRAPTLVVGTSLSITALPSMAPRSTVTFAARRAVMEALR